MNLSTVITNSGLTLNGLTVHDYLTYHDVHLNGGTDADETKDNENDNDDVAAENEDDERLGRWTKEE